MSAGNQVPSFYSRCLARALFVFQKCVLFGLSSVPAVMSPICLIPIVPIIRRRKNVCTEYVCCVTPLLVDEAELRAMNTQQLMDSISAIQTQNRSLVGLIDDLKRQQQAKQQEIDTLESQLNRSVRLPYLIASVAEVTARMCV